MIFRLFYCKNFNGTYEEDTDELYSGAVTVAANHANGNENCTDSTHETTAQEGKFSFTGRRADTYHVVVANPGSTDANGSNPLKFSLPESGGKFAEETTAEGKNTATASVVLDTNIEENDIEVAQKLMIGLQQPHTVTFQAEHATLDKESTKAWHGEELMEVPIVTASDGWRATGEWTDGTNTYSGDDLNEATISHDTTFTAVVKQFFSLSYDLNGGTGAEAPPASQHIAGEKVVQGIGIKNKTCSSFGWRVFRSIRRLSAGAAAGTIPVRRAIPMKNEYDNEHFFSEYAKMSRSRDGLQSAGEWHQLKPLFPPLQGKTVLDLGCGYGWHCKYAAEQGAERVLGLDLSGRMIAEAQKRNAGVQIAYRICGIEEYEYPENAWDLVVSNLALHYIENLDAVFQNVHRTLKKDGIFLLNIEHPVFTAGVGQEWVYAEDGTPKYWPVDDYFVPGERHTRFLGCDVAKQHHTLTQILMGLLQSGFELQAVEEAEPPQEMMNLPGFQDELRRPMMLLVKAAARKSVESQG